MLPGCMRDAAQGAHVLHANGSVNAYDRGLFDPLNDIGEPVGENEAVAVIHHPDTPGKAPDEIASPYGVMVLAVRAMAQVRCGDALYQIAADPA